jgi:hypothetical protein
VAAERGRRGVKAEPRARVGVELPRDVGEDLLADDLAVLEALRLGRLVVVWFWREGWGAF